MSDFLKNINKRLGYHRDNLALWRNGTLTPTEPDEEERACTIRGLEAAISALEIAKREYEANPLNTAAPDLYAALEALTTAPEQAVEAAKAGDVELYESAKKAIQDARLMATRALAKARGEEAPHA